MTAAGEELIADAIDDAEEVADTRDADNKPRLLVEHTDPDRTVAAMRDILKSEGDLYDRGIPVRLTKDKIRGGTVAQFMTPELLVVATHSVCRPYIMKEQRDGTIQETKTPAATLSGRHLPGLAGRLEPARPERNRLRTSAVR